MWTLLNLEVTTIRIKVWYIFSLFHKFRFDRSLLTLTLLLWESRCHLGCSHSKGRLCRTCVIENAMDRPLRTTAAPSQFVQGVPIDNCLDASRGLVNDGLGIGTQVCSSSFLHSQEELQATTSGTQKHAPLPGVNYFKLLKPSFW